MPPSALTPTSSALTSRSFLPVSTPSVDQSAPPSPSSSTSTSISPSTAITRPPTYHTTAPIHYSPQYTTASVQTPTLAEGGDLQRDQSDQSFQSWLSLFPEHTIPFVFRELLH
ncbi:hypothetical protein P3342_004019 [Pyrenophora teres f. teres]|nr:hypothetical protein P3342_004019 [Pyrenophora teres f. teres]